MLENRIRVELVYWQAEWQRGQTHNSILVTERVLAVVRGWNRLSVEVLEINLNRQNARLKIHRTCWCWSVLSAGVKTLAFGRLCSSLVDVVPLCTLMYMWVLWCVMVTWHKDTHTHTFAGVLHMFQLIWKTQDLWMTLFTLLSQEVKKCCIVTDGFRVPQLKTKREKNWATHFFMVMYLILITHLNDLNYTFLEISDLVKPHRQTVLTTSQWKLQWIDKKQQILNEQVRISYDMMMESTSENIKKYLWIWPNN